MLFCGILEVMIGSASQMQSKSSSGLFFQTQSSPLRACLLRASLQLVSIYNRTAILFILSKEIKLLWEQILSDKVNGQLWICMFYILCGINMTAITDIALKKNKDKFELHRILDFVSGTHKEQLWWALRSNPASCSLCDQDTTCWNKRKHLRDPTPYM